MNTKQKKRSTARRLFLEYLESRQVLAGNVLASVVHGQLNITGDAADNGVTLRTAAGGGLEVVGTSAGGAATTINGQANFTTTAAIRGTNIDLRAGNDTLAISSDANVDAAIAALVTASTNGTNVSASESL